MSHHSITAMRQSAQRIAAWAEHHGILASMEVTPLGIEISASLGANNVRRVISWDDFEHNHSPMYLYRANEEAILHALSD